MSLPKPDLHVRISEDAYQVLRAIALAEGGDDYPIASMAARVLEEALLGKAHSLKIVADRLARAGLHGNKWAGQS